jgi:hypothetical protein
MGTGSHQPRFLYLFDTPTDKEYKSSKVDKVERKFDLILQTLPETYFTPLFKLKDSQPYEMWPFIRNLIDIVNPNIIICYDEITNHYISEYSGSLLLDEVNLIKINDKYLYHYAVPEFKYLDQVRQLSYLTSLSSK